MSYSRSFRETLHAKNQGLYNRLIEIEKIAERLLIYTAGKFPYYTPHDFHHSKNCEENLCWLTPDKLRDGFNDYELFFAILACWFHDWGMIGTPEEDPERIRKDHHKRTELFFDKWYDKIRLERNEARIVGRICRGHRKEDLTETLFDDLIFGSNIQIRLRLITALVRIADECEIVFSRVPEIIYYSLNPVDKSKEEFERHLDTIGIGFSANHKIRIQGVVRDPKGADTLRKLGAKIQKEIDKVRFILADNEIPLDQVEVKLDARGFIDKPISFSLDRKSITNLLIGEHLYSRKDVAIRELLQNSIDACKLRKLEEKDYNPKIEIKLVNDVLEIKDNGFGMDYDRALSFLATKGQSYYNSEEFKKRVKSFEPISRFGLGVLSCFLISEKIIISTSQSGKEPCEFTIEGVDKGWTYKRGSSENVGTSIKLFLNEDGKEIDVREALTHYLKVIEVPVELSINGDKEVFSPKWAIDMNEVNEFLIRDKSKIVSFLPSFKISNEDINVIEFKVSDDWVSERTFLAFHGIYIGDFDSSSLSSIELRDTVTLLNLKRNLLDIDISREKLVKNEKLKNFRIALGKLYLNMILQKIGIKDKKDKLRYFRKISRYLYLTIGTTMGKVNDWEAFTSYNEQMKYPVLTSTGLEFYSFEQIKKSGLAKIFDFPINFNDFKKLMEKINCIKDLCRKEIDSNTAVVISPPLYLKNEERERITFVKAFCDREDIYYSKINMIDVIRNHKCHKTETSLDPLLPKGLYFGSRDKCLRNIPIPIDDPKCGFRNRYLGFIEINQEDELLDLKELDKRLVKRYGSKFRMGEFLLDPEDQVLSVLIDNSEKILKSKKLRALISRYFRLLKTLLNISPLDILETSLTIGWMSSIEQTLLSEISVEITPHKPINLRNEILWDLFISALQSIRD